MQSLPVSRIYKRLKTYPTYPVVLLIIGRFLNGISPYDCGISMIIVGSIGNEVDLSKELLFMML